MRDKLLMRLEITKMQLKWVFYLFYRGNIVFSLRRVFLYGTGYHARSSVSKYACMFALKLRAVKVVLTLLQSRPDNFSLYKSSHWSYSATFQQWDIFLTNTICQLYFIIYVFTNSHYFAIWKDKSTDCWRRLHVIL